jgi:hypothetical protein
MIIRIETDSLIAVLSVYFPLIFVIEDFDIKENLVKIKVDDYYDECLFVEPGTLMSVFEFPVSDIDKGNLFSLADLYYSTV